MTDAQKRLLGKAIRDTLVDVRGGEHTTTRSLVAMGFAKFVYPSSMMVTVQGIAAAERAGLVAVRKGVALPTK